MSVLNFFSLKDLQDSTNDLLHSPQLKTSLSRHEQGQTCLQMVSDSSLKMLDSCGRTKDILFLVKTHIQDLQSTFHRITLGETSSTEKKFVAYHHHRKDLRKQMLKRLKSLKITKNTSTSNKYDDDNLMVVVNVLGEVRETIISLLDSLMLLMSMPNPNPKARNSMNSNGFVQVKAKFMRMNSLSPWEKCDVHAVRCAIERLEAVESAVEDLEVELECIFKRLIRTRVLLLNILSN
ncbi:hypothetical protein HanRHA438_Chr14g0631681 [Helianthus annuus]|uniref:Uncharacterized protein n=1 Tax=Helianthus annuus TaxID=4232 RepID=A0A251SEC7_HELAN|nr:uncharacterized protein LOC110906391 [Helianthus annuus]KAF5767211.1 hypothetical protein HanXRQr2_Chr14g0621701 [Helianthus annuus]KAJ0462814.1 hypothetical protein HanHA300_Chr14g0508271 [Helianthus annuus]KAJ0484150.1 hypothetical protein HanHA89_Chr14g0540941 [Helianthus annuus]KAJ0658457.1 hypothetical protein HanOQP8_Chr14g0508471 [Helianthus annuus]KAJ0851859.1 hypothetical protein HanRHA438_Chr14g0631681 [Helianthus annuus]